MDIGANLIDKQFSEDLNQVVDNAFNDGIVAIILTGTSVRDSWNANQIVNRFKKKYPNRLHSTVGIHPHDARNYNEKEHETLEMYLQFSSVVAVGECGLDFNRNYSPMDAQIKCFRAHIELAIKYKLPLFIHERDAFDQTIAIFDEYLWQLNKNHIKVVIHCFTGNSSQVKEYIKRGFYIGITGWITDKRRNSDLVDALQYIPMNKLMVETDSPYLTPYKAKSRRNEPQFLKYVIDEIAKLRNESSEKIKEITIANTIDFFNLPGQISLPIYEDDTDVIGMQEKVIGDVSSSNDHNHVEEMWGITDDPNANTILDYSHIASLPIESVETISPELLNVPLPPRPDSRRSSRQKVSAGKLEGGTYVNKIGVSAQNTQKNLDTSNESEFPPLPISEKKADTVPSKSNKLKLPPMTAKQSRLDYFK